MIHNLPACFSAMECELVAGDIFGFRKLLCFPNEHAGNPFRTFIEREHRFHMLFWDKENVRGGLGMDIAEGDDLRILVEDGCREFLVRDAAEEAALRHGGSILRDTDDSRSEFDGKFST